MSGLGKTFLGPSRFSTCFASCTRRRACPGWRCPIDGRGRRAALGRRWRWWRCRPWIHLTAVTSPRRRYPRLQLQCWLAGRTALDRFLRHAAFTRGLRAARRGRRTGDAQCRGCREALGRRATAGTLAANRACSRATSVHRSGLRHNECCTTARKRPGALERARAPGCRSSVPLFSLGATPRARTTASWSPRGATRGSARAAPEPPNAVDEARYAAERGWTLRTSDVSMSVGALAALPRLVRA